jgi:major histocompatibility complex class I
MIRLSYGDYFRFKSISKMKLSWVVVVHVFNSRTWEEEAGRFLSSRPAWSTE